MSTVGSRPFTTFTYSQEVSTGADLYFNPSGLDSSYKTFKFTKDPEHQLYSVVCPEGKVLPSSLSGRYTKIILLQEAVDKWLTENSELPDYVPPQPKRSHHAKKKETEELSNVDNTD